MRGKWIVSRCLSMADCNVEAVLLIYSTNTFLRCTEEHRKQHTIGQFGQYSSPDAIQLPFSTTPQKDESPTASSWLRCLWIVRHKRLLLLNPWFSSKICCVWSINLLGWEWSTECMLKVVLPSLLLVATYSTKSTQSGQELYGRFVSELWTTPCYLSSKAYRS